jgi:hypothetical protein
MSVPFARYRVLAVAAAISLGVLTSGCTGNKENAEEKPSQQESQKQFRELQDRIMTTQIDR